MAFCIETSGLKLTIDPHGKDAVAHIKGCCVSLKLPRDLVL